MFSDPFRSLDRKGVGITYTIMTNFLRRSDRGQAVPCSVRGQGSVPLARMLREM